MNIGNTNRARVLTASLVLIAACTESSPGTMGELGQGSFTYECLSQQDVGCFDAPPDGATVPAAIAVGSRFGLRFHGDDPARIVSGSEAMVEPRSDGFLARQAGKAAMLAEGTADDRVLDFIHVNLVDVYDVAIQGEGLQGEGPLTVTNYWEWTISPLSEDDAALAGTLLCTWSSSDTQVVTLSQATATHRNMLYGAGAGEALITIDCGSVVETIEVAVQ